MRQLYVSAAPLKSLMVEIGGIAPIRGESTEATAYDNAVTDWERWRYFERI